MKSRKTTFLLAASLTLGWAGLDAAPVLAQPDKVADAAHPDARLVRASDVLNRVIKNDRNDDVGRVMDLIVDGERGQIAYAIARFGEWGFGQTRFAIPWGAFKTDTKNLVVSFTKDKIDKNRGFDKDSYPDMSDARWGRGLHDHFGVTPYWQNDTRSDLPRRDRDRDNRRDRVQLSSEFPWMNRVSEMIGKPVYGADSRQQGTVKDVMLDATYGHVVAYIVSDGGKDRQVPFTGLQASGRDNRFIVGAAAAAPATAPATTTTPSVTTPTTPAVRSSAAAADAQLQESALIRTDELLRTTVEDAKGDDIGRIMDLIIDNRRGQVAYAVMRFGQWHGQTRFAVPWAALKQQGDRKRFTLDITKDKIEKSQGFEASSYPDLSNIDWNRQVHQRFSVKPYWEVQQGATGTGRARDLGLAPAFNNDQKWMNRAGEMLGREVRSHGADAKGDRPLLGRLKDLVIDAPHGQVVYAVVSNADDQEKLAIVPWSAMELWQTALYVRSDKDALFAQSFKEGNWPKMADAQWAKAVHQRFDRDPYWTVFGFGGDTNLDSSWRRDSEYNKLFKEADVRTIRGKVTRLDTFTPASGAAKGRMITIKTDDDMTYNVHLGPASYVDINNKFVVREGDEVALTGSIVKFNGETVMIANRIRKGDESLQLRNRDGVPMWDRDSDVLNVP